MTLMAAGARYALSLCGSEWIQEFPCLLDGVFPQNGAGSE